MRAVVYEGPRHMRVSTVPDPRIEAPDDLILKVTATAICGSDLHMYNGFMLPFMKPGDIMGHEFMGTVIQTGPEVTAVKPGDRVIVPFVIACGSCYFCERQTFSACETTNPGPGGSLLKHGVRPPAGLYGFSSLYGANPGGQAEYVRVQKANFNAFKVPAGLADEQVLFLTDILPTGYQAVVDAGVGPGSTVAILGAGPVGQMAAMCARMLGAERIFMVDDQAYRLDFAVEHCGVIPVDFSKVDDPAAFILEQTDRRGVDAAVDAVGFEAKGSMVESALRGMLLETGSGVALREGIGALRRGGTLSVPGVYLGFLHGFLIGDCFDKGLRFAMGQTHVHKFVAELLELIRGGKLRPELVISHRLPLEDAPRAYQLFADKQDECRKVVLYPWGVPKAA
jgi:threonine dehydrogenase-like Zn-dependent dehydrogenase